VNRKTLICLLFILGVAAAVRLAALDRIPYGVFIDEGVNGVEGIQAVRAGHFHFFYPANSTEGPLVLLIGFSERIVGVNQFGLRLVPALAGVLTVVVTFFFTRRLYSDRVGLLAAWFVATGFWHVLFSRLAINAVLFVPLLLAVTILLLRVALDRKSNPGAEQKRWWLWALFAGVAYGCGFYTYLPFRATPVLIVLIFILEVQRSRNQAEPLSPVAKTFAVFVLAALVVVMPLVIYFAQHPSQFTHRMSQVTVTNAAHPISAQLENVGRTAAMFNFHGDENWRHNFSGSPQLLTPVGIFFLVGLWMTVAQAWRGKWRASSEWMLLAWFVIMLLPEMLTKEGIPHAMRAFGVIVPVYLFAGLGADQALALGSRKKIYGTAILVLIIGCGVYDQWRYFHDWARHGAHVGMQTFSQQQADESAFLNSLPASTRRFVISDEGPTSPVHSDPTLAAEVDYHMAMRAQTVAFGTMDHAHPCFLTIEEAIALDPSSFPAGSVIIPLEGRASTLETLQRHGVRLEIQQKPSFAYAVVR
jgi:4-amino-4-deoxy-L-arabinose transferase-like glycosyltransferase